MSSKASKISTVRREYGQAKRLYKTLGKKAFGKSKKSEVYKDYKSAQRYYKKVGSHLGKLTGRKPRRGK